MGPFILGYYLGDMDIVDFVEPAKTSVCWIQSFQLLTNSRVFLLITLSPEQFRFFKVGKWGMPR